MSNAFAWADAQDRLYALNVPIAWPNERFKPPVDSVAGPQPYLVVELSGGASQPIELGGSTWQAEGQTWVHVLVPALSGVGEAHDLVDRVVAAFRAPPYDPVIYTRISADPGGPGDGDGGNYWVTSVSAEWKLQTYVVRG